MPQICAMNFHCTPDFKQCSFQVPFAVSFQWPTLFIRIIEFFQSASVSFALALGPWTKCRTRHTIILGCSEIKFAEMDNIKLHLKGHPPVRNPGVEDIKVIAFPLNSFCCCKKSLKSNITNCYSLTRHILLDFINVFKFCWIARHNMIAKSSIVCKKMTIIEIKHALVPTCSTFNLHRAFLATESASICRG